MSIRLQKLPALSFQGYSGYPCVNHKWSCAHRYWPCVNPKSNAENRQKLKQTYNDVSDSTKCELTFQGPRV